MRVKCGECQNYDNGFCPENKTRYKLRAGKRRHCASFIPKKIIKFAPAAKVRRLIRIPKEEIKKFVKEKLEEKIGFQEREQRKWYRKIWDWIVSIIKRLWSKGSLR